jgi:hypothetical protein
MDGPILEGELTITLEVSDRLIHDHHEGLDEKTT